MAGPTTMKTTSGARATVTARATASAGKTRRGTVAVVRADNEKFARPVEFDFVRRLGAGAVAAALVGGLAPSPIGIDAAFAGQKAPEYVAELVATKAGAGVSGTVTFTQTINRSNQEVVQVTMNVSGLTPGKHGINVHENGNLEGCDAAGACTGKSYNPDNRPHHSRNGPDSLKKFGASASHFLGDGVTLNRHIGDLGNIVAEEDGKSTTTFKDLYTSLTSDKSNNIAGKSVVIRAKADDYQTEEDDGDAGPIVAYGAILPKK